MGKVFKIRHMGTDFPIAIANYINTTLPVGSQFNMTYSSSMFSDLLNAWTDSPMVNQPLLVYGGIGGTAGIASAIMEDFGARVNQAEKMFKEDYDPSYNHWFNDKKMKLYNNGKFVNPINGRWFELVDGPYSGQTSFKVYTQNDALIFTSDALIGFHTTDAARWQGTFLAFTDFDAFVAATTWSDAAQYVHTLEFMSAFDAWGGGANCAFRIDESKDAYAQALWVWFGNEDPAVDSDDDPYSGDDSPYQPGGEDGGDGDGADPYDPGDDIDYPDNPDVGLSDSGLLTVYTPTPIQLRLLGNYLWSQGFVDSLVKSVYADPMDVIISLGLVPFNIPAAGTKGIKVGDRNASIGETVVTSNYPASDFIDIDCGSIHLKTTIGCYLDYAPYTKGHVYIPFVGYVPLDVDYYMSKHIGLKYKVELVTGTAIAFLLADGKVMQQFTCNVKIQVPLSSANAMQMWRSLVEGTLAAGALVATGGAAGGATIASGPAAMTAGGAVPAWEITTGEVSGSDAANILNGITTKPSFQKSNPHTVSGGYLASKLKPYIILERPNMQVPTDQGKYTGYGAYATKRLGNLKGYTRVSSSRLSIPSATGSELVMIRKALHSGVIIDHTPVRPEGDLVLMTNSSPTNQIGKNLITVDTLTGSFRDSANIRQLTVRIEKTNPVGFNYIYSSKFGRFYFIDEITVVRTGVLDLHCSIDVLETFGSEILANDAIIDKQEKDYNLYLNDNGLKIRQDPLVQPIYFPSGFGSDYEFVLVVAGSN